MKNPLIQKFDSYQRLVIAILAFLQFTIVLDFMILAPLGAFLMPALDISPSQFGLVVSAYAFSAAFSGVLAAGYADRFDRKKILLFFYSGFVLGTFLCGIARDYHFLLIARIVTGLFGGVIGSIVLAIATDLFPIQMRGRVMGFVQTAFAASQVLGIPAGLYLSNLWDWHASFLMIVAVAVLVGILIFVRLKPITGHLAGRTDKKALHHLGATLSEPRYLRAFVATGLMTTGGFMIMPFSSAYNVSNVGISIQDLPMVYLFTGLVSIFAGPLIGRIADRIGKFPVFVAGSAISIVMVLIYTHLGVSPLWHLVFISMIMFIGISSRIISFQALVSAVPETKSRGAFMALNSSIQQLSGGIASAIAGMIVFQQADGKLDHFDTLGYCVVGTMILAAVMLYFINRNLKARLHSDVPLMK